MASLLQLCLLLLASSATSFGALFASTRPPVGLAAAASSSAAPAVALYRQRPAAIQMMAEAADSGEEFDIDAAVDAAASGGEAADAKPAESAPAAAEEDDDDDGDLLSTPAFLKQKLKVLEKEMTELEEQTAAAREDAAAVSEEWADKRARLQGDFDNFRARHTNQTLEAQVEARIKMLQDFLPVLDNFDRARTSINAEGEEQVALNARYEDMHASLMLALEEMGLEKIPTLGEEFDYNLHMALQTVPSDEYEEDKIAAEMQPGYTCKGQLVRAAYVMVSSGA